MYRSRSNSSRYGIMESSSIPVLALRHSSRKDAGPVHSEAATGELADIEPQNIEKEGLVANHGKEDGKLVPVIASRSSKIVEEVGYRRIIDDVGCKRVTLESGLRVNSDMDYRSRAPESHEVLGTITVLVQYALRVLSLMKLISGTGYLVLINGTLLLQGIQNLPASTEMK